MAWAPGKGVKGKDLKDYWEGDLGVSYIPYNKLKEDMDLDALEDGGKVWLYIYTLFEVLVALLIE